MEPWTSKPPSAEFDQEFSKKMYRFQTLDLQASKWRIWLRILEKCFDLGPWTSKHPSDEFDIEFINKMCRFGALDLQASKWRIWLRILKENESIWSLGSPSLQVTNLSENSQSQCIDLESWSSKPPSDGIGFHNTYTYIHIYICYLFFCFCLRFYIYVYTYMYIYIDKVIYIYTKGEREKEGESEKHTDTQTHPHTRAHIQHIFPYIRVGVLSFLFVCCIGLMLLIC